MKLSLWGLLVLFSTTCESNVISFGFAVHNANQTKLEEENRAANIGEQDEVESIKMRMLDYGNFTVAR